LALHACFDFGSLASFHDGNQNCNLNSKCLLIAKEPFAFEKEYPHLDLSIHKEEVSVLSIRSRMLKQYDCAIQNRHRHHIVLFLGGPK
jgi:hypothetical protein